MAKVTKTLKKTTKQASKNKQDKAAAARGGTKPAKKKSMPQRSEVVKGHQRDLARMGSENIGFAAGREARRAGKSLDMAGYIRGKEERKAKKATMKSFKRSK